MKPINQVHYLVLCLLVSCRVAAGSEGNPVPRLQLEPLPDGQVSFLIDGTEKTRWHFAEKYSRPFFFPFNGPSGVSLTRMGHPGAPNHDHHRSIWFAHYTVNGINYWEESAPGRIRQGMWLAYEDGDQESIMATQLEWLDGDRTVVMEQEVVAALIAMPDGEHALEIQTTMKVPDGRKIVELGRTNFGFLAVRVARSISGHFGGGTISDSEGNTGERNIFGKKARWMDYSGPLAAGQGAGRKTVLEGVTYFDHPSNPRYPTYWHVREDGWMGASFCLLEPYTVTREDPLVLRYLLYAHSGGYYSGKAEKVHAAFAARSGFIVAKGTRPHCQYDVRRIDTKDI